MKKLLIILLVLAWQAPYVAAPALPNPALIAVLMIKDEAPVIEATLQPLVNAGITAFYIFDTGSTDDTVEIVHKYFKEKSITNYQLGQEPFVDFSTSRNRALELCEQAFPNGGFMLMLDAEWHLVNGQELVKFCHEVLNSENCDTSYLIQIKSYDLDFHTQRLIKCRCGIKFKGVVHENPEFGTRSKVPASTYFDLCNTRFGIEKTIKRMRNRDLPALLKEYKENPHAPRTTFYLAETYECIGDWENAYKYYKRRTEIAGWDEENFIARYKMGLALEHLAEVDNVQAWPQALHNYLEAYTMRPTRAEPLIRIAKYYLSKNNFPLTFAFAKRACEIPFPENDCLFVEKRQYEFDRWDVLGIAAWYTGDYEIGEDAVRKAMKIWPDAKHLAGNLALYEGRKKEQTSL